MPAVDKLSQMSPVGGRRDWFSRRLPCIQQMHGHLTSGMNCFLGNLGQARESLQPGREPACCYNSSSLVAASISEVAAQLLASQLNVKCASPAEVAYSMLSHPDGSLTWQVNLPHIR